MQFSTDSKGGNPSSSKQTLPNIHGTGSVSGQPVARAPSTTNSTDQHSVQSQSKKRVKDEKQVEEETELLSHLDQSKLNKIKDLFGEDGLQLNEFLEVMLENLDFAKSEELKITMRLIDLFKEIDVNGDETLEWHEFSNHIIELGMLKKDRTVKEIIKNYYPSDSVTTSLRPKHDEDIEKVYYFEELKNIIAIEKKSKKFQVYSYANPTLLCDVQAHRGEIVAAELVKVQGTSLLATTAVDLAINFWDTQTFKLKQIISTPDIQQVLRYARWGDTANDPELLYTGGNDAIIHVYDLRNFRERSILPGWNPFLKRDADQKGHSGPVMDILPIKEQKILASAALDGRICLWDAATEKNFETLGGEGAHLKGITCLDWHAENSWLLSCGLDHDVFVFNTYVQEKIYTLKGHAHPLVGVKCVPGTYQLVTADIKGMVKIWDIRTMLCCQSFNATDQLNSFCVTYPKKRIVIGSKTLSFYDYDEPKDQYLSDEKSCLRVIYNETLFMFVTLHLDTVKVWDAKDGQLKATHRGLTRGEFTSCCLDDRERKLLICDTQGNIIAINVRNGATLKKFHSHRKAGPGKDEKEGDAPAGPVTDIGYCKVKSKLKVAITSSDLATLKIHDDSESDPTKSRNNEMSHHKKAINCIAIKPAEEKVVETISMLPLINQKPGGSSGGAATKKTEVQITEETGGYTLPAVVASGGEDGLIMVTNLASYRIEAQLKSEGEKPFKKVIWLGTHDVLVGADNEGRIYFYGYLEDRKFDLHCITEYRSASQTSHSKDEITPVSALGYDKDRNLLVLGDVFGNVEIWNVTKIVDKAQRNKRFLKNKFGKKQQTSAYDSSGRPVKNESMFLTETVINSLDKFTKDDVVIKSTKRRSHLDGITHIDVISQHRAYATSSYDCCVLVWSIDKQEKLGALLLGGTQEWKFRVGDEERRAEDHKFAKHQLESIEAEKEKQEEILKGPKKPSDKETALQRARGVLNKYKKTYKFYKGYTADQLYDRRDSQSFHDDESTERELMEDFYEMQGPSGR